MFIELGIVLEQCQEELDTKIDGQSPGQTSILASTVQRWFDCIRGQAKMSERQLLETLGNK